MIKLLQAKEDIYWEDSLPDQKPFCKKGGWYEVISSSKADLQFKNEEGMAHRWSLSELDEDFWTVDFDKGFEFKTSLDEDYSFKNNFLVGTDTYYNDYMIGIAIGVVKRNGWIITRFSNQTEQPSVEERPFENWKKDIGIAKFQRCIEKPCVVFCVVDEINGYLDRETNTFYYHKFHQGKHTYISCSVAQSVHDGWHFVRENKDSSLVKAYSPEAKGMVAKEDVLASFSVPVDNKDIEQQESSKGEVEVSSAEAGVWTDKHYDFSYTLTEEDIEAGEIKIDPYFVSYQWKLGEKDNSGALWHCFKGIARFGEKNPVEREIKALHAQVKRLAEIHKVDLG